MNKHKKYYYIIDLSKETGMTEDNVMKVLYRTKQLTKSGKWSKKLVDKKYVGVTKAEEVYFTKSGYDYIIPILMDNYIYSRSTNNNDDGSKYKLILDKLIREGYEPPKNRFSHKVGKMMIE